MEVLINGKTKTLSGPLNLRELLDHMQLQPDRCAVELNRQIISRGSWETTALAAGDQIEIVHFVGGG